MKRAILKADGASLGNPGPAGIGVVIETEDRTIEISEHIGTTTNNVAEYTAFVRGLEELKKLGAAEVDVRLDSELLVKQIKGEYRVKNEGLKPLYQKALGHIRSFRKFTIRHVPREENTLADRLSKQGARGESLDRSFSAPKNGQESLF